MIKTLAGKDVSSAPANPFSQARHYLAQRQDPLLYGDAREPKLPVGSGEIESGHRHVIQQRIKLAGDSWKQSNFQPRLNLRVLRAGNQRAPYWQNAQN